MLRHCSRTVCLVALMLLSRGAMAATSTEELPTVPDHDSPWLLVLRPQGWVPLRNGDLVRTGDRLVWRCAVRDTMWVYVVNRDRTGGEFVLFPLPDQGTTNPLVPGSHTLPSAGLNWVVTSTGEEELVEAIVCRRRCEDVERSIRSIPRARPAPHSVRLTVPQASATTQALPSLLHGPPGRGDRLVLRIRLRNQVPSTGKRGG
jgi:hypothetical protein